MATSISQIPVGLRNVDAHDQFINWLAAIPAPSRSKKRVLVAWGKFVNVALTETDFSRALSQPVAGLSLAKT